MIVGNDISSAPPRRAANFGFFQPRAQDFERPIEQLGPQRHRSADSIQFIAIFDHPRALDDRRRVLQSDTGREHLGKTLLFRNRKVLRLEANRPSPRPLAPRLEKLAEAGQDGLVHDHDLRSFHFLVRLGVVANVGKEDAPGFFDKQKTCAAGEAAKVPDIGKMADE
jgi:hypothetical protein